MASASLSADARSRPAGPQKEPGGWLLGLAGPSGLAPFPTSSVRKPSLAAPVWVGGMACLHDPEPPTDARTDR